MLEDAFQKDDGIEIKVIKVEEEGKLETNTDAYIKYEGRSQLPVVKDPNDTVSMWGILKNAIGKDLSKFAMPVKVNEPLGML